MGRVKFKLNESIYSDGGTNGHDVLVDGEVVGYVKKSSQWYGNLGHRGVRYTYFDFYVRHGEHTGTAFGDEKLGSASTRKDSVAEGLVALGMYEAAIEVSEGHAKFHIDKRESDIEAGKVEV